MVYKPAPSNCRFADVSSYELQNVILHRHTDVVDKAKEMTRALFNRKKVDQEDEAKGLGPATLQLSIEGAEAFRMVHWD